MKRIGTVSLILILLISDPVLADVKKPGAVLHAGRTLAAWIRDLDDSDPLIQEESVEVLAQVGPHAKEALPRLRKFLSAASDNLRVRAALAVWRIGGESAEPTRALAQSLRKASTVNRVEALQALAQMGPVALPAVEVVMDLLDDADNNIKSSASTALSRMGAGAVRALVKALEDKELRTRRNASAALVNYLSPSLRKEHRPALEARLADPDLLVRVTVGRLLWTQEQAGDRVLAVLHEGVKSSDASLRIAVLGSLAGASTRPKTLVPLLETALACNEPQAQVQAARMHFEIEKKVARVLPIYQTILKDSNRSYWESAIVGLADLGPEARPTLERLIEIVRLPDFYSSWSIRTTLARMGPVAIPPAIELLKETKARPGFYMAPAETGIGVLGQLGAPAAKAVLPLLADKDAIIRERVLRVLTSVGVEASFAVPQLITALDDSSVAVRNGAINALQAIGEKAKPAVPALLVLARGKDTAARILSMRTLAAIGAEPKLTVSVCLEALKDANPGLRQAGLDLLAQVEPAHPEVLPRAMEMLRAPATRPGALQLLQRMGPAASSATAAVTALLGESNLPTRAQAIQVLTAIGPGARASGPKVLDQLTTPDPNVGIAVLNAIKPLEIEAKLAVPALIKYMGSNRYQYAAQACVPLGEFGAKAAEAFPEVQRVMQDPQQQTYARLQACLTLVQIDRERARKEARAEIVSLLTLDQSSLQPVRALLMLDPADKEGLVALEAALVSPYPYTRASACLQIRDLGEPMKKFLPQVRKQLADPNYYTRGAAAVALWKLTGLDREARPVLEALLKDASQPYIRASAATLLADLGSLAAPALPALRTARSERDPYTRTQIEQAIRKIESAVESRKAPPPDKKP